MYVNVPSPPLADGNVNELIAFRCTQLLSPIVCTPNVGMPSTSISNVNVALSPSASVTVHVYSVLDIPTLGVPLTVNGVVVARLTPSGRDGLRV